MKRLDAGFFNSRFARRIFLLFVVAALLPIVLIAFLSYEHISGQLREQSYEQSRQSSKAIGMELFRRLSQIRSELDQIGGLLRLQSDDVDQRFIDQDDASFLNIMALAIISKTGEVIPLRGVFDHAPLPDKKQEEQLARGKTVIQAGKNAAYKSAIYMIKLIDQTDPAKGALIGEVNAKFFWSVVNLLPGFTDLAVLGPSGELYYSTYPLSGTVIRTLKSMLATSVSGHFEWRTDEINYLASYWSVFTDVDFSIPGLVIMTSQPESKVLAPIIGFRVIYVPILILAVLVVALVVASQIRRKIAPLIMLRDATGRIASGDFSGHIDIRSDDELAELGDAFNAMAGKLDSQFKSITTMAEIDQLILSSFDSHYIIETVLNRVSEITPCSVAAVLAIEDENSATCHITGRITAPEVVAFEQHIHLAHEDLCSLNENPDYLLINRAGDNPTIISSLLEAGDASSFMLFPVYIKQRLSAVVVTGYRNDYVPSDDATGTLRKFADHVAIALSNAAWEERLYHQAHYDALTNLPNRALLKDRLEQAIARSCRNRTYVGVVFVDLDRFKMVNDSLGHTSGDQLLKHIASQLSDSVRSVDTVVRFGGDEFVIIVPDIDRKSDVVFELRTVAERILSNTKGEYEFEGGTVHTEMSIGISLYPRDGDTTDILLKNADAAMYHAKARGRGRYEFFAQELNAAALHRLQLEQDIRHALVNSEFMLNYQPKVDCIGGKLVGAEALIRWQHPGRGFIPPSEFIPIAEETGLIREISDWVLMTACLQTKAWCDSGLPAFRVAVNVSPRQFNESDFAIKVADILKFSRLDPGFLELEVTEGTVMENIDEAIRKLNALKAMGIYLSVDDFGTGYSSLSYLMKLPIHALKIDQSFIAAMNAEQESQAIVSSTIYLAHQLGLEVVAEGVETGWQKELLQKWQCDELQGYLISKPVPPDQFEKLLSKDLDEVKLAMPPRSHM